MKKYMHLLKYELKTIYKDQMNIMMLLYPLMMLAIMGFLFPKILEKTGATNTEGAAIGLLIGFIVLLSAGGYIMGAMLGFLILEHKDEHTIANIAVTPIRMSGYLMFKIIYTTIFAFIGNFIMVGGLKLLASPAYEIHYGGIVVGLLDNLSYVEIILFSLVNSLLVPVIASVIGGIAKNKIEGFAYIKLGGFFIMIPTLLLLSFFQDFKQFILSMFPHFWGVKAILVESLGRNPAYDLTFYGYLLIGFVYQLLTMIISVRYLIKKLS